MDGIRRGIRRANRHGYRYCGQHRHKMTSRNQSFNGNGFYSEISHYFPRKRTSLVHYSADEHSTKMSRGENKENIVKEDRVNDESQEYRPQIISEILYPKYKLNENYTGDTRIRGADELKKLAIDFVKKTVENSNNEDIFSKPGYPPEKKSMMDCIKPSESSILKPKQGMKTNDVNQESPNVLMKSYSPKFSFDCGGFLETFLYSVSYLKSDGKGSATCVSSYGYWISDQCNLNKGEILPSNFDQNVKSASIYGAAKLIQEIKKTGETRIKISMESDYMLSNVGNWIRKHLNTTQIEISDCHTWDEYKYINQLQLLMDAVKGMVIKWHVGDANIEGIAKAKSYALSAQDSSQGFFGL